MVRSLVNILLMLLLLPSAFICKASDGGECDSLIRVAVRLSIEKDYEGSMQLLAKARELAGKDKSQKQMFWVLTNIGINHAELTDYGMAMQNFLAAYKIASEKLDSRHQMSILNNIAGLYMMDHKFAKAKEYYLKIYSSVKNSSDSLFIGGCAMNIVNVSLKTGDLEAAKQYLATAATMLVGHTEDLLKLKSLEADYLMKTGRFKEANAIANEAYRQACSIGNATVASDLRKTLIKTYLGCGDYRKAIAEAADMLKENENLEERVDLYSLLAEAYAGDGRYEEALACKDSLIEAKDSVEVMAGKKIFENNRILFELFRREKEVEEYENQQKAWIAIIVLALVLVAALAWALINRIVSNRQKRRILELERDTERQNRELLQRKLDEEKHLFHHEIEMKGRELVANAMVLANRTDQILKLTDAIAASETIRKANDTKVARALHELQSSLDVAQEWKHFTAYFEQVNNDFLNALQDRHPDLTANEIRFLSLVYINLSTKEIAVLLNITPEYCKKRKQQITHKMGLATTKELYGYLISM